MDPLAEIKKRIDIVEYINRHVSLQKAGRNFRAPCPFHAEKTPSFIVSPERQIWHCFGSCNEGGDIFKFLMKWENLTFGEALKILADQAGVKLEKHAFADQNWDKKQRLLTINQYAADFYQFLLEKHKLGDKARRYLDERKVNLKSAKHFYLGYAPRSWDSLFKYLSKKGYSAAEINLTGLLVKSGEDHYYDRFRSRLIFPLSDMRGNILGFSGRILEAKPDPKDAKYINTPETTIYHKRENLFGLHQASREIKDKNEVILVEGEFDVIMSHQFGYKQAVAIKGSALTRDHLRLIKRLTNKLTFALDMDSAGQEAVRRSIDEAEKFDFEMHVVNMDKGKDPADVFRDNPAEFEKYYQKKRTIYEHLIEQFAKKEDLNTVYGRKNLVENMLPYLTKIYNPIVEDHYLKLLSEKTATTVETIKKSMNAYRRGEKTKKETQAPSAAKEKKKIEETLENYLVALFVQTDKQPLILEKVTRLAEDDFFSQATCKLFRVAQNIYKEHPSEIVKTLANVLPQELLENYNKGFLWELPSGDVDWAKEIERNILNIKKHSLRRQIKKLMEIGEQSVLQNKLHKLKDVEKRLSIV